MRWWLYPAEVAPTSLNNDEDWRTNSCNEMTHWCPTPSRNLIHTRRLVGLGGPLIGVGTCKIFYKKISAAVPILVCA